MKTAVLKPRIKGKKLVFDVSKQVDKEFDQLNTEALVELDIQRYLIRRGAKIEKGSKSPLEKEFK